MDHNCRQDCAGGRGPASWNTGVPNDVQRPEFTTPPPVDFNTEEMRGSMQLILADNIGEFVVIEFLIGTEQMMRKQDILYFVGTSYVTLYDDMANNFIVCEVCVFLFSGTAAGPELQYAAWRQRLRRKPALTAGRQKALKPSRLKRFLLCAIEGGVRQNSQMYTI